MAEKNQRGKKITIVAMPDGEKVQDMMEHLRQMRKADSGGLSSLVDRLREGIKTARDNGVEWDAIARYLSSETMTEISADAIAQSYTAAEGERLNAGRKRDAPSYAALSRSYAAAIRLLAKICGTSIEDAEKSVQDEILAEREKRRKKKEEKKEKEGEAPSGNDGQQ